MAPRPSLHAQERIDLLFYFSCLIPALCAQTLPTRLATSKEIRDMLVQRVDVEHKAHAIIVGLISKRGREIISYGKFGPDDPRVPDAETIFEIGSVTKVFTSLLLSEMVLDKEVSLNDPIAKYLPRVGARALTQRQADHAAGSVDASLGFPARAGASG